jgi:phage tail-like protein
MKPTLIRPYDFILESEGLMTSDENGQRPYRLVGRQGIMLGRSGIRLAANERATPPLADEKGSFGGFTLAHGVTIWHDTIFFADPEKRRILFWQPCWPTPRLFPAASALDEIPVDCPLPDAAARKPLDRELHTPVGLTISAREDLVVVDRTYRRLLLFTLPGYALRRVIHPPTRLPEGWPDREPWLPVDAAPGPRGSLFVADANGYIWKLDAQSRLDPYYQGVLPLQASPERIIVDDGGRAYVIVSLPGRRVVITLDRYGWPVMVPCRRGGVQGELPYKLRALDMPVTRHEEPAPLLRDVLPPARLRLEGRQLLLLPDPCRRQPLEPIQTGLTVDDDGYLVLPESLGNGPYAIFVPPVATFPQEGALIMELDGRNFGNPWHRVALDRQELERTGVRLYSLTSDQPRSGLKVGDLSGPDWNTSQPNLDEWLVQSTPGRYLYLGLQLFGPGDRTPTVERLYVYRERQSSLDFLPATYSADADSRFVLDRLLSLFDTIYGEIETTLSELPFRLDVASTPPEFLSWLAAWFGLLLEAGWTDRQRRAFLGNIMQLYRWRGTRQGIELLVRLHTGLEAPLPRVIEHYRAGSSPDLQNWLNAPGLDPLGLQEPQLHFSILLPGYLLADAEGTAALRKLLDAFIPAQTHYTLRRLPGSGFRIYHQQGKPGVLLGVDTLLGEPRPWQLPPDTEPDSLLDVNTLLPESPLPRGVALQLGRSRLSRRVTARRPCRSCRKPEEEQNHDL